MEEREQPGIDPNRPDQQPTILGTSHSWYDMRSRQLQSRFQWFEILYIWALRAHVNCALPRYAAAVNIPHSVSQKDEIGFALLYVHSIVVNFQP